MILSNDEKHTHQSSMLFFREILQKSLKALKFKGELTLIAFGLHIDDEERYIYFDFPISPLIDKLNEYLLNERSSYYQIDSQAYNLLSKTPADQVKFIAYQYEYDAGNGRFKIFDIKTSFGLVDFGAQRDLLIKFFAIMYFSAHPILLTDIGILRDFEAELPSSVGPDKWFLFFHHKAGAGMETDLIANFGLDNVSGKMINSRKKLRNTKELLIQFADSYAGLNKNIVIKKVKERADQVLTTNYLLFHWLKQVNMTFVTNPLIKLNRQKHQPEVAAIISDAERIDSFYDRFMNFYKTVHFKKTSYRFSDLDALIGEWTLSNPEIGFELKNMGIDHETHCFTCEKEYTNIMFRSIIENGVKALNDQMIPVKKICIYWDTIKFLGKNYISITITSVGTLIEMEVLNSLGHEAQRSARGVNSGIGLFLVNRHLASLDAYQDPESLLFFEKLTRNTYGEKGFTLKLLLPQTT